MKYTDRRIGRAVVIDIEGKLLGAADTEGFHGLIKRLLSDGEKRIVINLEKAPWASSQGIGLLIGALTSVSNAGGRLVLANACDRIREVLRVTRLMLILESFSTLDLAVESVLSRDAGGGSARVVGLGTITMV